MIKLCKDCKYYYSPTELCERPAPLLGMDYLQGKTTKKICVYASCERTYDEHNPANCGREGRHWKPSLRYRIINLFRKNDNS